ncbi:MAG: TfuA-like protein [Dongiaceae bacterium]
MTVIVFTGPTISAADARAELEAVYLPPAAEGDVYRAALDRPQAIGIVDGYFEAVPAVWHKEILAAMADGIHVFGSASIGALRAAELAAFGMEGVGTIFESFRDGILQDDDEVAVVHGPAETGYVALSDAMVNIRATLERAMAAGVVSAAVASELASIAKRTHYKDRRYDRLLQLAQAAGLPPPDLSGLRAWLPGGKVDRKRLDALAMLRAMRRRLEDGLPPKKVAFRFEHTRFWENARFAAAGHGSGAAVVEEAKLDVGAYRRAAKPALARYLALCEARRLDKRTTAGEARDAAETLRRGRGLEEIADLRLWLKENELDDAGFDDLIDREVSVAWVEKIVESSLRRELLDELRLSGDYPRLARRAREKERLLAATGAERSTAALHDLSEAELLRWYAGYRGVAAGSLVELAAQLGFSDLAELRRALIVEYLHAEYRTADRFEAEPRAAATWVSQDLRTKSETSVHPNIVGRTNDARLSTDDPAEEKVS